MIFRIICVLIIIRKSSTEANAYYEYSTHSKWIEAQKVCALATPAFRSELGENVVNITHTVTSDLWVGYFKALTGFEYKGCIRNANSMPHTESAGITIGRCFSECGRKQLVGISRNKCYCEDQIDLDEVYQSKICYIPRKCNASVCNSCDENKCVSIYKVNKKVPKDQRLKIDEGMCLRMNNETRPNKRYGWTDCGQHYLAFCDFVSGPLTSMRTDNWRESINWCFALKGNPFTYTELETRNDSFTSPIWTSITCSYVIYTHKEFDNNLSNIRFGYLASKDSRAVLKFKDARTTQKKALCTNESPETSTRTVSTPEKHGSTDNVSTKSPETLTRTVSTPERHGSTDTGFSEQSTTSMEMETETATTSMEMPSVPGFDELNTEQSVENQDPDASAIIGASVCSVLFVIAVAVALVVLKRRNKLQTPCKGTAREEKSHDTSLGDITHTITRGKPIRMTIKNDVSESNDTNDAHTYFVLEKHVKEEAWIDDTTYNTTYSAETNKEMENRNIYNKLEIDADATYDHAQKKRNIDHSKAEDTYDTSKMEALATKVDNNPDKFGDTNEDAYNHINGKPFKTCRTDNAYGVPHYLGNSIGEVDPLCGGDTYSHINNTLKRRKPDNEYSVPSHLNASSGESNEQEVHYDVTDTDIKVLDTDNEYSKIGTLC